MRVVATRGYDSRGRKLFTAAERATAELEIALQPAAWPVVVGTGGARKGRAARGGRGKKRWRQDNLLRGLSARRSLFAGCLCQEREGGFDGWREKGNP